MDMCVRLRNTIDGLVLFVGGGALLSNLYLPYIDCYKCLSDALCIVAGMLGWGYIFYAIVLWCQRPRFDWHLINGHFLRKVCCLVLLMPSLLASMVMCRRSNISTPKELVYEDALYEEKDRGVACCVERKQINPNIYWSTYYHFIDPGNQHMTTTKGGRNWASIISILGVFLLNGLLVSSIIGYIDRRKEKWQKGEVKYRFLKRYSHYVVIGGNDMVGGIVRQLLAKIYEDKCFWARFSRPYILIQTSRDVEACRRELFSILSEEEQKRIIIYYGSRTSEKDIKELCIEKAEEVYILGEETRTDDIESYHDTMNMECLNLIRDYIAQTTSVLNKENRLVCRVMFEYQTTFSVFQFYDIDKEVEAYIDFRPFNYYELCAQKVLVNKELDPKVLINAAEVGGYLPLEGLDGIKKDDNNYVHLFIVGMSRMGIAMGIEAAHLAHYPNYETKGIRTKITFIDKNAAEEKDYFMGRFKELFALSHWRYGDVDDKGALMWREPHIPLGFDYLGGDFLDIEWEFVNSGIEQTAIQDYILASANPLARITIAVCLPESNRSHAAALYLNKKIYESDSVLQVLVYNRYGDSIVNSLTRSGNVHPYCARLKSFGLSRTIFEKDILTPSEKIGKEINNVYNNIKIEKLYAPTKAKYKGKSTVANNWSSLYCGNMLWTKLRCVGYVSSESIFTDGMVEVLADVEHNRWNIEELLMNFRPLTSEEQEKEQKDRNLNKEILKGEMAHVDICSNKKLLEIDSDSRKYDIELTKCLPAIYANLRNNVFS